MTRYHPRDPEAPRKYYAPVKYSGRVTRRELFEQIAEFSTVSTVDTMAVPTTSNPGQAFKPVLNNMEFGKNGG